MKKIMLLVLTTVMLSGCGNQQFIDTTYTYDRAVCKLQNGEVVDGKLTSWRDYDSSDSIQVVVNGKTYYTHLMNCTLIAE